MANKFFAFTFDGVMYDNDVKLSCIEEALNICERTGSYMLLVTNRTRNEMFVLLKGLSRTVGFITESGSAIYIPKRYNFNILNGKAVGDYIEVSLGAELDVVREYFTKLKRNLKVVGFSELKPEQLDKVFAQGNPLISSFAGIRAYSEGFLFANAEAKDKLGLAQKEAYKMGLKILNADPVYYIVGKDVTKSMAIHVACILYADNAMCDFDIHSFGINEDDKDMLAMAEYAYLMPRRNKKYADINIYKMSKLFHYSQKDVLKIVSQVASTNLKKSK